MFLFSLKIVHNNVLHDSAKAVYLGKSVSSVVAQSSLYQSDYMILWKKSIKIFAFCTELVIKGR